MERRRRPWIFSFGSAVGLPFIIGAQTNGVKVF
jgi:hypothetical protein